MRLHHHGAPRRTEARSRGPALEALGGGTRPARPSCIGRSPPRGWRLAPSRGARQPGAHPRAVGSPELSRPPHSVHPEPRTAPGSAPPWAGSANATSSNATTSEPPSAHTGKTLEHAPFTQSHATRQSDPDTNRPPQVILNDIQEFIALFIFTFSGTRPKTTTARTYRTPPLRVFLGEFSSRRGGD